MPSCELISATLGTSHQLSNLYFRTLADLKQFIGDTFKISVEDILLLLPCGIILKKARWDLEAVHNDITKIYVFDRGVFTEDITFSPRFELFRPLPSPMSDSNLDKNVVIRNLGWLKALQSDVILFQSVFHETNQEISRLLDCGKVILDYLKVYCLDVESLYNSNVEFLNNLHQDGASNEWKLFYDTVLGRISIGSESLCQLLDYNSLLNLDHSIKNLDQDLNGRLKSLKTRIDACYDVRKGLVARFDDISKLVRSNEDEMDVTMLTRFEEMSSELEVISVEFKDSNNDEELLKNLSSFKDEGIPKLQTISQSLYSKASDILKTKTTLQHEIKTLYIGVATSQMEIIEVKSKLLKDINKDLKLVQSYESQLSQVIDLPICYGLYLIELYREQNWTEDFNRLKQQQGNIVQKLIDDEIKRRASWSKDFKWISQLLDFTEELSSPDSRVDITLKKQVTLSHIKSYLDQLIALNMSRSTVDLLKTKLSEVELNAPLSGNMDVKSFDLMVDGYKARIQKLENILLETQFHKYNSWPAGILNNEATMLQLFRGSTINSKLQGSISDLPPVNLSADQHRSQIAEIESLNEQLSKDSSLIQNLEADLNTTRTELSDANVELGAYRESMKNLNKELSRLLIERESFLSKLSSSSEDYKKQISLLATQNEELTQLSQSWRQKFEDLDGIKENLLGNISDLEKQTENEKTILQGEIEDLRTEIKQLNDAKSPVEESIQLKEVNDELEANLYDQFQSSIFILESIGLLLSKDADGKFQIVRVKGLRKDMDGSVLDLNGSLVKSIISQEIKSAFDALKGKKEFQSHEQFIEYINKLFGKQLFESSVIKRFNDIENLAKKLRKENKEQRILLQQYSHDKIAINNFQPGDHALFLPINNEELLLSSSISSLNSSFSSIDLNSSTASIFPRPAAPRNDAQPSAPSEHIFQGNNGTGTISLKNASKNPANDGNPVPVHKNSTVWAIFTATNNDTRYILRNTSNNYQLLRDKEWVMGRITGIEKHVVTDVSRNPFKFPKNTIWYEVDALFNFS